MNLRKITSLTALISFIFEILTSVILYIVPQGRVAYWSDWHLWGLSKTQWGDLHINLGILLFLAIILHCYYNWSVLTSYLKNRAKELTFATPNLVFSLLLTVIFSVGTYFSVPPFSTILDLSASIKDAASKTYGEPPYGHAELSTLTVFTEKTDLDLEESVNKLRAAGIKVDNTNQTLAQIAKGNNLSPKEIFLCIKPEPQNSPGKKILPPTPAGGFGKKPLAEICLEYNLNCAKILNKFNALGLTATTDMSLKEIGAKYERNPHDLYDLLKQ